MVIDFAPHFRLLSESLTDFADNSKLDKTDENGVRFYRLEDGFALRLVTVDNIDVQVKFGPEDLSEMAGAGIDYYAFVTANVINHIAEQRKQRRVEGEDSIIIPTRSEISKVVTGLH